FANVDVDNSSVTIGSATIEGGEVTVLSTAQSVHYFKSSDFQSFDIFGEIEVSAAKQQEAVDAILGGIEGFSLEVGVSVVESDASITIGLSALIDATDFTAHSTAVGKASACPTSYGLGVACGIVNDTANVTVNGTINATGNVIIESTTDNTAAVKSNVSAIAGYNGAVAVSVFNVNSTADVTDLAHLTVGGSLFVQGDTIDRDYTAAIANSSAKNGKLGVSLALSFEFDRTSAYLDGAANVTGGIDVNAIVSELSINTKKLELPATEVGVTASTSVGSTITGDYVTDLKNKIENSITGPITNAATKLYSGSNLEKAISNSSIVQWFKKTFPSSDGPDKFDLGAA